MSIFIVIYIYGVFRVPF